MQPVHHHLPCRKANLPPCLPALLLLTLRGVGTASGASASSSSGSTTAPAAGTGMDAAGTWSFSLTFDATENAPVLTAGHLRVAYAGEAYHGSSSGSVTIQDGSVGSSHSGSLQVDSQGTSGTVTFRGRSFKLLNRATSLQVGQDTYTLDDGTDTMVRFAADGTAKVAQTKWHRPSSPEPS